MSDGELAVLVSVGNESYMLLVAFLKLTISTGGDFFNEDTSELLSIDDICKKRYTICKHTSMKLNHNIIGLLNQ